MHVLEFLVWYMSCLKVLKDNSFSFRMFFYFRHGVEGYDLGFRILLNFIYNKELMKEGKVELANCPPS